MAVTPLVRPVPSTGVELSVVVPFPSWPKPLYPQHLIPPPMVSPQLWLLPAEMAATPLVRPVTSPGSGLFAIVAFPSWPEPLEPQHLTPPPVVRAQVWPTPAETEGTALVTPDTSTGFELSVVVPSPS